MLRGGPGPDGAKRDRPTHFHSDYPRPVPRAACKMSQTLTATLRSASAVIKDEKMGAEGGRISGPIMHWGQELYGGTWV